jgi:hypothetical protein
MKRTTIYFEPELEEQLKAETIRRNRPMAELVRADRRQSEPLARAFGLQLLPAPPAAKPVPASRNRRARR